MRRGSVAVTLVLVASVLSYVAGVGVSPEAAAAQPPAVDEPVEPIGCVKKIVKEECSSCAEAGVEDKECKSGRDFESCSTSSTICTNGAFCNQHVGIDPCR